MVDIRRQVVDTDSVNTNSLEQSSISQANLAVAERVLSSLGLVACLAAGLVRSSDDLEALAGNRVDEVGALDDERGDGSRNLGAERNKRNLGLVVECQRILMVYSYSILVASLSQSRLSKTCLSLPNRMG